ncbi:hypothetical protein MKW98_011054 [Papaver atlanticum]|uniref:RBR-type E3 ubiquitin transferase n=1 Tax=Papaver atlanticum TaxID=357466 RepID=A0AAD4TFL4_9MAGN|nr:hypothetical protein MKW98_011054 [Papaver atlanticum]
MDSEEDDMYDNEDYFDENDGGDSNSIDNDDAEDDPEEDTQQPDGKNYTVMNIRDRQQEDISSVCNVLLVSRVSAIILLVHFNWSVTKAHDEWFADEEKVRKAVGLFEKPVVAKIVGKKKRKFTRGICFAAHWSKQMFSTAGCNHLFCRSCWKGYINTLINDGPGCLTLRCPDPSCNAAVGEDMVNSLVCKVSKEKYSRFLFRSYVEVSKNIKWCPAPGCSSAIQFAVGSENRDVTCKCTYSFCWSSQWNLKNSNESENLTWILANSKPCPKCQRPIEKNHGCMHMSCLKPCRHQFCWLCLGPWSEHGTKTGGNYRCNQYNKAMQEGAYDEEKNKREMAKKYIEKYSMVQAVEDLKKMQSLHLNNLSIKLGESGSQLEVMISDAWLQIIECRRVLKWTYAYGYYLTEDELAKKQFFEYLQGEAENGLERLHKCAEKELQPYLQAKSPLEGFTDFCVKLRGLTTVTRDYFENLVRALESGLSEVHSEGTCSKEKKGASSEKKKSSKKRLKDIDSIPIQLV